jgi:hypothetical protein
MTIFNLLGRLSEHEVIEVSVRREQPCQLLASVKHPRLHGVLRKVQNLGGLFDRLVVIVDEVNDFAVIRRYLREAAAQLRGSVGA